MMRGRRPVQVDGVHRKSGGSCPCGEDPERQPFASGSQAASPAEENVVEFTIPRVVDYEVAALEVAD